MAESRTIAVVGATGAQGGGLVRAILADRSGDFRARALTRKPASETGRALAAAGAEVVAADLEIDILGPCKYPSPLAERLAQSTIHYVGQADRVLLDDRLSQLLEQNAEQGTPPAFELAGPRDQVFFQPSRLRCGIVTCGGLCPGLNNVVRGLVVELTHGYGVSQIYGFRYGYEGLVRRHGIGPVRLTPTVVSDGLFSHVHAR